MSAHGGSRPGAGRKARVPDTAYVELMEQVWRPRVQEVYERFIERALSNHRDSTDAMVYILNRLLGKPTEQIVSDNDHHIDIAVERVAPREQSS